MTDFELRGTFYLGDAHAHLMEKQAAEVMDSLLEYEHMSGGKIRDAAVSLDLGFHTIEIELVVTAESFIDAHARADEAVASAFGGAGVEETSVELALA